MNHWKIGDRAVVDCPVSGAHGKTVTVTSKLILVNCPTHGLYMGHEIDHLRLDGSGECIFLEPHELKPIPDEYDGNEVTTWVECPFKPGVTV